MRCFLSLTTNVDAKLGRVTLNGVAESATAKNIVWRLAMNTRGVASVDNQLVVTGTKETRTDILKGFADEAGQNIADS